MCGSGFLCLKMCMLLALFTDMNKILKYPWPGIQSLISAFYPYLKFFTSSKNSYIVSFVLTLSIVMIDINYGFESNYGYIAFLVQAVTGLL